MTRGSGIGRGDDVLCFNDRDRGHAGYSDERVFGISKTGLSQTGGYTEFRLKMRFRVSTSWETGGFVRNVAHGSKR